MTCSRIIKGLQSGMTAILLRVTRRHSREGRNPGFLQTIFLDTRFREYHSDRLPGQF